MEKNLTFKDFETKFILENQRPKLIRDGIDKLYSVNYIQPSDLNSSDKFKVSLAFTVVDWYLSERLAKS